jgi:hypothetical protein
MKEGSLRLHFAATSRLLRPECGDEMQTHSCVYVWNNIRRAIDFLQLIKMT